MEQRARVRPPPVQVDAHHGGPGVTHDNAVDVDHGDQLDDVVREEPFEFLLILNEPTEDGFHDEGGVGLTGMHSSADDEHFSFLVGELSGRELLG